MARDHTGQRFGMLRALRREGSVIRSQRKEAAWLVRCDCGAEKVMQARVLVMATSCGCVATRTRQEIRAELEETKRRLAWAESLLLAACSGDARAKVAASLGRTP
jgi:hypothetical protein